MPLYDTVCYSLVKYAVVYGIVWYGLSLYQTNRVMDPLVITSHTNLSRELVFQIVCLRSEGLTDLIVLSPSWLCNMIGQLLHPDQIKAFPVNGHITLDKLSAYSPGYDCDVLLAVACHLDLCIPYNLTDDSLVVEFPCLNFMTPPEMTWPPVGGARGAVRMTSVMTDCDDLLSHLFRLVQLAVRRLYLVELSHAPEGDLSPRLHLWLNGIHYSVSGMQCRITLRGNAIQLDIGSPESLAKNLFYFLTDMMNLVTISKESMYPGLVLNTSYQYPTGDNNNQPFLESSKLFRKVLFAEEIQGRDEIQQAICLGSADVSDFMFGCDLPISLLPVNTRRSLATMMDVPDPLGNDWCLLALRLGLSDRIPFIDDAGTQEQLSKTDMLLGEWETITNATIGKLVTTLIDLGRTNVADLIMDSSPLYAINISRTGSF